MDDCVFCRVAAKKAPAAIVYEDDELVAFDDIHPAAPVHVLIIPREHFASLNDVPADREGLLGRMMLKARDLAAAKGIGKNGYRLVLNTGPESGQAVFHIHLHLLGGRRLTWPPG